MNNQLKNSFATLIPFIILGIAIALVIGLLIMFSYVVLYGVVIGAVLWLIFTIKNYFFKKDDKKSEGRIIEHNDTD